MTYLYINQSIMACVYKHIRSDTGEVFYIGIGKNKRRAYAKSDRNDIWKKIVKKSSFSVEIIHENITWNEACNIEKDLIKKYGRKDLNCGPLANMTDGGEGTENLSPETINKIITKKAYPTKKVLQYSFGGEFIKEWNSINAAAFSLNILATNISACCRGKAKSIGGFIWRYKEKNNFEKFIKICNTPQERKVCQYNFDGEFIRKWNSVTEAAKKIGADPSSIVKCCKNKYECTSGFRWTYENDHLKSTSPVYQYTISGEFIKKWNSSIHASVELNIQKSSITRCCNGERSVAGNFIWKYKK